MLILWNEIVHIWLSLGELHFVQSLTSEPVQEGSSTEHGRELLIHSFENVLRNGFNFIWFWFLGISIWFSGLIFDFWIIFFKILTLNFKCRMWTVNFKEKIRQNFKIGLMYLNGSWVSHECGGHFQVLWRNVTNGCLHVVWDPIHKVAEKA